MILFNLKLALRNLVKNRIYSTLIISGFAIGFAACILIGLFYNTETSVNSGFANHQQIYRLYDVKRNLCNINWDLFPELQSNFGEVENACPVDYATGLLFYLKNEQSLKSIEIEHLVSSTNNFFSVFSVEIVESMAEKPLAGLESFALSQTVAKKLFGAESPLGKKVNLNNIFSGTVTAIFKELPSNSSFQADVIMNSEYEKFRHSRTISNGLKYNPTNQFVWLKESTDARYFAESLNRLSTLKALDIDSLALQSLDDIYLSDLTVKSRHAKGNPKLLKIFLAIAGLILLLSSINYLNFSISMQYAKLKEIGINKTNGAGLKDLINYTLAEVFLGILVSVILSVFIALIVLPYSGTLFGKELHVTDQNWIRVVPFFMLAVVFVILGNSFGPIYIISKFKITEFLSGFRGNKNRRQTGKQAMMIFQLTVSIALIAAVVTIFKQLDFVKHSDPGFNRELLVRIDIPYKFGKTEVLGQELEKLPFVAGSSISYGCPGMINMRLGSNSGEKSFNVNCIPVGKNYLKTMGIELLEGRDFLSGDLTKACLINEEAYKQFEWDSFEGNKFNNGQEGGFEVVGVVKDFKFESFRSSVEPLALLFSGATEANILSVRLLPGNKADQISQIKKIWKDLSPNEPLNLEFYDDNFQAMYEKEEKLAGSISFFSLIAIALTCMGILGQIFMMSLKIKEIGIRKINGARISEVIVLLNKDFFKWVAIAFVLATPVAWFAMQKWLENFAYKTTLSWWIFALAGFLALGIAFLTVSWQSWRAATRNPVEALRYE